MIAHPFVPLIPTAVYSPCGAQVEGQLCRQLATHPCHRMPTVHDTVTATPLSKPSPDIEPFEPIEGYRKRYGMPIFNEPFRLLPAREVRELPPCEPDRRAQEEVPGQMAMIIMRSDGWNKL